MFGRFSLLEEYAGEDDESGAVHGTDGGVTPPLEPEERAAIVEEAIADMLRREQEQCEENLQFLSSLGAPRKKIPGEPKVAKKLKIFSKYAQPTAIDGSITSMKSEVLMLPKGGPIIRKVTFMKPKSDLDEDDDEMDDLGRQMREIRRMQRQTSALKQKLAAKQLQLKEVLLQQAAAHAALASLTGRRVGRRKRADVEEGEAAEGGLFSAGDTLTVLRAEEEPAELALASDMLSVPADLAEAKRIIFSLRQEVLTLRNSALKHAHTATMQRIDTIGKEVKRDVRQAAVVKRLRDGLSSVFSRAQQSRILKGKKIVPWESEDYMRAIALRRLCRRRTFEFVRNTMKIPLPSMFALRSAAAFGRFPEVSRGFKELREQKRLRFITGQARAKQDSLELEPREEVIASMDISGPLILEPLERPLPRRCGRGRGSAGKKRWRPELVEIVEGNRRWSPEETGAADKNGRWQPEETENMEENRSWRPEEAKDAEENRRWRPEEAEHGESSWRPGEVEVEVSSPRKPCWNAVDLTELIEFEQDERSSSMDDSWSRHVQSSLALLGSPRGRGRGLSRPRPAAGGKRAPGSSGQLSSAQEL